MSDHIDHATYWPRRANLRVENLAFDAEVDRNGQCRVELGKPVTAAAAGIVNALSIATQLTKAAIAPVSTFKASRDMGPYGRNLTVVLSGAGTPTITIRGRDYLGQPMAEAFTGNGTTPVVGKKAFYSVDDITTSAAVAATTVNVGYGNVLGLPYAAIALRAEYIDDAVPTAGTFAAAVTTAGTATSGDPRGTYAPHSTALPNGARNMVLDVRCIMNQLHGVKHYYA